MRRSGPPIELLALSTCLLIGCNKSGPGSQATPPVTKSVDDEVVNLYIWG